MREARKDKDKTSLGFYAKITIWLENLIVTRMVPLNGPGPFFRLVFKGPLVFYKFGLGSIIGKQFLILSTIGRKSGKIFHTSLGYTYDLEADVYQVMAGWGGKTDWYRNARVQPNVYLRVGKLKTPAFAEPVSDVCVAEHLRKITERDPGAMKMWSRWADMPVEDIQNDFSAIAPKFPMLNLHPLAQSQFDWSGKI